MDISCVIGRVDSVCVHTFGRIEHESCNIPQLVCKFLICIDLVGIKVHVGAWCIVDDESHAEGVCTVFFLDFLWGDDVTFALTHLFSMLISHHAMQIHFFKRHCISAIESKHDHACDPEENNIFASLHDGGRVVGFKIITLGEVGGRKWPLSTREPRIECIRVFFNCATTLCTLRDRIIEVNHSMPAVRAEFRRNRDAPDDLSRDIPVLDLTHPVTKDALVSVSRKMKFTRIECSDCTVSKRTHFNKPLTLHLWFDLPVALIAAGNGVLIGVVNFDEQAFAIELLDDLAACIHDIHARKLASNRQELAAPVDYLLHLKLVFLSDLEVDIGVPWGDSHRT